MEDFLRKSKEWYKKLNPLQRMFFVAMLLLGGYLAAAAILPAGWIYTFWNTMMYILFMVAVCLFVIHITLGAQQWLSPLYKVLYRLTGDETFLTPIKIEAKKVTDYERSTTGRSPERGDRGAEAEEEEPSE